MASHSARANTNALARPGPCGGDGADRSSWVGGDGNAGAGVGAKWRGPLGRGLGPGPGAGESAPVLVGGGGWVKEETEEDAEMDEEDGEECT